MANQQRGVYEPSDEVRVFDGAEDDDDEEGSRLPVMIVLGLLAVAMFGGVVWYAYQKGVASGRTEPAVITAQAGPAKVAPDNPGGVETPYKGVKIYDQPAPNDEEADQTVAPPAPKNPLANKAAPVASTPAPALRAPVEASPPPKAVAIGVSAPPKAKPEASTTVPLTTSPSKVAEATAPPKSLVTKPASASSETGIAIAKRAPPPARSAVAAATSNGPVLQIGAYKSEAEANQAWTSFQAKHTELVAGFEPNVKKVDLGDKGIWYRLRMGSFADKDAANAMCDRLKADGGNCFLAR